MRGTMDHLGSTSDAELLGDGDGIAQITQIHPSAYYSGPPGPDLRSSNVYERRLGSGRVPAPVCIQPGLVVVGGASQEVRESLL